MPNPLHTMPFDPPVANALLAEYRAMPWQRRWQARRKAAFRRLGLRLTGQHRLLCDTVPAGTRHALLVCSWTTVGDAIMDLSARHLVPDRIRLDLCIAPHLAPLFDGDAAFAAVTTSLDEGGVTPDFIVLDCLTTALLRDKVRRFPNVPFATLRGGLIGECYDRTAFADRRVRQLFGLPPGPVASPRLSIEAAPAPTAARRFRVAVAIGARRAERRYPHWSTVLAQVADRWPDTLPPPEFWLLGSDNGADDLACFGAPFLRDRCVPRIAAGTLRDTAGWLRQCDAFLAADGGLMHLAVALGVPGVALFTRHIRPEWRLPADFDGASLQSATSAVGDIEPRRVVEAVLRSLVPA